MPAGAVPASDPMPEGDLTALWDRLAGLFDFPGPDYPAAVVAAREAVAGRFPTAGTELAAFARRLPGGTGDWGEGPLEELREIFTRTFDVQAITTLDVGYVVFGDDYKRGELLVHLGAEHREAGVECGHELPDHLPNVLRLLPRWEDRELAAEFVREILHPALERMIAQFDPDRTGQRNWLYRKYHRTLIATSATRADLFRHALAAVLDVLRAEFELGGWVPPERDNDFLGSLRRELETDLVSAVEEPAGSGARKGGST